MIKFDDLWSKIIRIEVLIALTQQIWSALAIAIGAGGFTTLISWVQGNTFGIGFPFYAVVFFTIFILTLIAYRLIMGILIDKKRKSFENFVNSSSEFPIHVYETEIGSNHFRFLSEMRFFFSEKNDAEIGWFILSLVAEGKLSIFGYRIAEEATKIEYAKYLSRKIITKADIDEYKILMLPENYRESQAHGRYYLEKTNGEKYGNLEFSLVEYVINENIPSIYYDVEKKTLNIRKN